MASTSRIFTIPPGRPFLTVLAQALLEGNLPEPGGKAPSGLELPDITLFLPQRAARAMQAALLAASGRKALLLPRIRPIGMADEGESLMSELTGPERLAAADIPPAMPEIERRLGLTELVLAWSKASAERPCTPAQASLLARELARLLDEVETEGASLAGLASLVPDAYSAHWQRTLRFLEIITAHWPAHLAEKGMLSPAERRNRLIAAEAARLAASPPAGPVIFAGVFGSVPATAMLMRVVAGLEQGAVVLPGLDQDLDAASWAAIGPATESTEGHPEHPQHGMNKLLAAFGVTREQVRIVPGAEPDPRQAARARFVAEAMRPSATTDRWHELAASPATRKATAVGLAGVTLLEAPTAVDEAEAIALILRKAVEEPGRTAALVTPDRNLGRRVAVRLESWDIRVDDSAGRPLAKTPPGIFLDHVVGVLDAGFRPEPLMALLKHPLARLGLPGGEARRAARALELIVFRQAYIGNGLAGIRRALARAVSEKGDDRIRKHRALRRLHPDDWRRAEDLLARLSRAYAPFGALAGRADLTLQETAAAHVATAEALAADERGGAQLLWHGEEGEAAALFLARLTEEGAPSLPLALGEYADFYRSLLEGETVRPSIARHPRIAIWGPFEARLMQPDRVVLGGLVEGVWPGTADPGPWLNRGMRAALGLPSPEERIGFAAHDLTQLLGAPEVVLTRAAKVGGNPTVPSRWLLRIEALLGGMGLAGTLAPRPDEPWLDWAAQRNEVAAAEPVRQPAPCPPLEVRPRTLSVSAIEQWIANPYHIYARYILGLEPLPELAGEPGADLRGSLIHQALHRFARAHPDELPDDVAAKLVAEIDAIMADHAAHPRVAAFWRPRFRRFAEWFAESEPARREGLTALFSEVEGEHALTGLAGGEFTLTARADRIDVRRDGLVITDYKTGSLPSDTSVTSGSSPQLPLESAIAAARGFPLPGNRVAGLRYISAKGGEPPGLERMLEGDPAELGVAALAGLAKLVARFDDPATPYKPLRRARFDYRHDRFAHLARVGEWKTGDDEDEAHEEDGSEEG